LTALKPLETLRVRGVSSIRYPGNKVCAHPECTTPTDDFHHIFPRSLIGNGSWFVEIDPPVEDMHDKSDQTRSFSKTAIPHVVGLCRTHHEDVEQHRSWIKLEEGEFLWLDRSEDDESPYMTEGEIGLWFVVGPLNPQPGAREGKPKTKKRKAEKARNRVVKAIRVPKDEQENGIEVLDTLIEEAGKKLAPEMGWDDSVPAYYVITASLAKVLQ